MTHGDLALHSPEAERAVLGCVFLDPECAEAVAERLCPEDFSLRENREIFTFIREALSQGQPVGAPAILKRMQEAGAAGEDMRDYIVHLMEITPTSAHAMEYAAAVGEKARLRAAQAAEEKGASK